MKPIPFSAFVSAPNIFLWWFGELRKLGQPTIALMVTITAVVGYLMAVTELRWVPLLVLCAGTFSTSFGAKILNHWMEVPLDAKMLRTQNRPLVKGTISEHQALILGVVFIVPALVLFGFTLGGLTALICALTVGTYVWVYTPLKTRSSFNTVVGAVPGALPMLGGWVAGGGALNEVAWALTGILFLWQFPHFLAIAWLCRSDYARAGFKMLPLFDSEGKMTGRQMMLYSFALLITTLLPTLRYGITGHVYLAIALGLGLINVGIVLWFNITTSKLSAKTVLHYSHIYLLGLMIALVADQV